MPSQSCNYPPPPLYKSHVHRTNGHGERLSLAHQPALRDGDSRALALAHVSTCMEIERHLRGRTTDRTFASATDGLDGRPVRAAFSAEVRRRQLDVARYRVRTCSSLHRCDEGYAKERSPHHWHGPQPSRVHVRAQRGRRSRAVRADEKTWCSCRRQLSALASILQLSTKLNGTAPYTQKGSGFFPFYCQLYVMIRMVQIRRHGTAP